ncbi:uncharacterized protein [Cherax quadricarinatus]|uniref:uncharacterized protein n=1 Tax=Cherax quadricarinatus TaxID=27406 RepID=UPI00387EC48C
MRHISDTISKETCIGKAYCQMACFTLVLLAVVGCGVLFVTFWPPTDEGDSLVLDDPDTAFSLQNSLRAMTHHHHQAPRAPPPMWRQTHHTRSEPLSGIPMLMLVTTRDISIISRSVESALRETAMSGVHLVVSVTDPSEDIMDLLQGYPLKIHVVNNPHKNSFRSEGVRFLRKLIPRFSLLENFKNIIDEFSGTNVCMKDTISPVINILNTGPNLTETTKYQPTMKELQEKKEGVPYEEHPYNPIYRKAVINSRNERTGTAAEGMSVDQLVQNGRGLQEESHSQCQRSKNLKDALQFVKTTFPELQYLMLLETGYTLSPNFVSYFKQTLEAMQEDPSIYCISAHNPLASPLTSGDITRVYRYDHFVAKATLIPSKVLSEILKDFVIYEETLPVNKSALESLETWLSWWSRRRRRGCVVPDVPRICYLHDPYVDDKSKEMKVSHKNHPICLQESQVLLVNTSRLLHYKYSQDLFNTISAAEPLGSSIIDCNDPNFFPQNMNASCYIIYIKMENYDDDFTFHHIMKCFGLNFPSAVGYFEGIFQFTFRHSCMLLMGIPYSRFSPSMKNSEALIVADIPKLYVKGIKNYLRHKNYNFTFNTVVVKQNIS